MYSNRYRRNKGVGSDTDLYKRCVKIAENWKAYTIDYGRKGDASNIQVLNR